jgi:hypothetical protein
MVYPHDNSINIYTLYNLFGANIPKYNYYAPQYLLCVNSLVNVKDICKKNNYEITALKTQVIDKNRYNNNYTPYQTYFNKNIVYTLEKLNILKEG